ncbi:MAG TPA: LmeA family phospholipid-binding protein [Micropruina sp.]|jgi:hypothetical protein|nr:LmeA family phospholipid-binding protein [Micropruina sp.]
MKAIRRILIAVLVLAVVLAGAEFGVRALVQSQAQQALTGSDLDLEQPTMTLGGGSVLAALAQGRFVDVSGTAASATVQFEQHAVPVTAITYQASDIRLASTSEAVIGRADLAGTLGYAALSEVAGLPIAYGDDGRVLVTYTVDILGLNSLKIGISAVPQLNVATQQVDLEQSRIDVAGIAIDESLSQQIIERVVKPISLAANENTQVTAITVHPEGLVVDLTATDLPVRR